MAGFAAIFAGPGALQAVGINNPPAFYLWAHENKVLEREEGGSLRVVFMVLPSYALQFTSLLLLHFVVGQIETQLLSTGAFEVYIDGTYSLQYIHGKPCARVCFACYI